MDEVGIAKYIVDLGLPDEQPREFIPDGFIRNYPWKGIIFCGGPDHLKKAGALAKLLISDNMFAGDIVRVDSWETDDVYIDYNYCRLLIITNVAKGLFFENVLISGIQEAIRGQVPILLTSAHELKDFEKEVSLTTLTVIETFLLGEL